MKYRTTILYKSKTSNYAPTKPKLIRLVSQTPKQRMRGTIFVVTEGNRMRPDLGTTCSCLAK